MNPLNTTFVPPAAVVPVVLQNPFDPERVLELDGLIDTGSDLTAIPETSVEKLALRKRTRIEVTGVDGQATWLKAYIVNLQLAKTRLERRLVVAWAGEFVVLGRDLLSEFTLVYDGKTRQFEVRDP